MKGGGDSDAATSDSELPALEDATSDSEPPALEDATSDSELPELIDAEPENVDARKAQVLVILVLPMPVTPKY